MSNAYATTTTVQQQTYPTTYNAAAAFEPHRLKSIRSLAIAEVVLGVFLFLFGAVILGLAHGYSFAEGVWAGILTIVAGSLGIHSAGNPSSCIINGHMTFSILGSIACAIQTAICGFEAWLSWVGLQAVDLAIMESDVEDKSGVASLGRGIVIGLIVFFSFMALMGFICFILQIVSASHCCRVGPNCCGGPSGAPTPMMVVTSGTQQVPVMQEVQYPGSGYPQTTGYAPL